MDLVREFGQYLRETREWSASCGPVAAIVAQAGAGSEAWELFWTLLDELRAIVEAR